MTLLMQGVYKTRKTQHQNFLRKRKRKEKFISMRKAMKLK